MKYVVAALIAALLLLGWLYRSANKELVDIKGELATAQAVNAENARTMANLERSIQTTDKVLADWNQDRTTLAGVRNATRQAMKEAIHDENFKTWADSLVPSAAWSLLRENYPIGADADYSAQPSGGAAGGLPGNANTNQRDKR
jgi:hypothetical protein